MSAVKGKELEALVLKRAGILEGQKVLTLGRYGVQAVMMNSPLPPYTPQWQVIPSLPDLEGVIYGSGRQIIIECKVCSQASYPIYATDKKRPKQIEHMLHRAEAGALCFLLLHFNARELIKKSDPAATYAIPVHPDEHFWRMYGIGEIRSIGRADAGLHGIEIPWDLYSPRATTYTPNLNLLINQPNPTK